LFPQILDNYGTCFSCKHSFEQHTRFTRDLYLGCGECDCRQYRDKLAAWIARLVAAVVILFALGIWAVVLAAYFKGQL
jgi:hypothetical protein